MRVRRPGQQPGDELPVAADPAVASLDVGAVAGRIFLVQLHVAEQAGAGVAALQQIVAEYAVFRKAASQRLLERRDVVNTLADEGAFLERVLIHIGHRPRIRVDAWLAAIQAGIARLLGDRQAGADARLQDAVAGVDAA